MSCEEVEGLRQEGRGSFLSAGRARSGTGLGTSEEKKELWCDAKSHLLSYEVQL